MTTKKNPQGRKAGATIKKVTDREKFASRRKGQGTGDGEWKLVRGVWRLIKK
ncbi:hypothetical protein ACIRON_02600 [Nocardioides sp. NPDC101246]|uniref:hypothetical protein n=1 Tax=Nocardioides sp. NPDC101246 TaxID=3364336 RepID=UPI0037FA7CF6